MIVLGTILIKECAREAIGDSPAAFLRAPCQKVAAKGFPSSASCLFEFQSY